MDGMGGMMDGVSGGGFLTEVLVVGLVVLWSALLFGAGYYLAARHRPGARSDDSLSLLRRRLASGDIDDDQYLRLLSTLEQR